MTSDMPITGSSEDTIVEVSVKNLTGINFRGCREKNGKFSIPRSTATVTFSGSAPEMKVRSSSVCGLTGQLLVESEPLVLDGPPSNPELCSLSASWNQDMLPGMTPQPHLTMQLPPRSNNSGAPLLKANRGSRILNKDESPVQPKLSRARSFGEVPTGKKRSSKRKGSREKQQQKSPSRASEIVELFVRLKSEEEDSMEHLWQGVAYLVVFGHELDRGTNLIEIPIRRHGFEEKAEEDGDLFLASDAKIVLQVVVTPSATKEPRPALRRYSFNSRSANSVAKPTATEDQLSVTDSQTEPLLVSMITANERVAREHAREHYKAQHKNVSSSIPAQDTCTCEGFWSWSNIFTTIHHVVQKFDGPKTANIDSTPSMCSTIETRDSLNI